MNINDYCSAPKGPSIHVIPGFMPGIHHAANDNAWKYRPLAADIFVVETWIPGTSPGMTSLGVTHEYF
jgi:hypothetical protein